MCDAYPTAKSINIYLIGMRYKHLLVVIKLNLKSIRDRASLRLLCQCSEREGDVYKVTQLLNDTVSTNLTVCDSLYLCNIIEIKRNFRKF